MCKADLLILVPVCIGFVIGLFKGFIKEIASLSAIFLGILGAKIFAPLLVSLLQVSGGFQARTALPLSWLILFVIIGIAMLLLARSLEKLFDSLSLGSFNKLLGGIFGALKYALVISVMLVVVDAVDSHFSIIGQDTKSKSLFYKPMTKLAPMLWDQAKRANQ